MYELETYLCCGSMVSGQPDVTLSHGGQISYIKLSMDSSWMGDHIKSSEACRNMGDQINRRVLLNYLFIYLLIGLELTKLIQLKRYKMFDKSEGKQKAAFHTESENIKMCQILYAIGRQY